MSMPGLTARDQEIIILGFHCFESQPKASILSSSATSRGPPEFFKPPSYHLFLSATPTLLCFRHLAILHGTLSATSPQHGTLKY
ncbi:hypothetical protein L228DRAFT_242690 [Xylona heveae TC161]|uniref:Uncharacterized protein n=1 Tax=Xylona heveae (strain CBS 132557 / TC161) TaxID=1328760 RepID=A0A165JHK1_XYLHT|nr:hypothetical protein L228DRAFT_242690 [Xylona heveae TC161]KZF26250.1 hypothetical protein L228DRAFT_242690 [Xylona heveae TC161]